MSFVANSRSEQAYWDSRYAEWWDRPYHGMRQDTAGDVALEKQRIRWHLESILRPHHRVLDAACGYGRLAPIICPLVSEYVGVDFSARAIGEARANAPENARYIVGDIANVELGERFDVVVMVGVWSSIADNASDVLCELRSTLTGDGVIVIFEDGEDRIVNKDGDEWAI